MSTSPSCFRASVTSAEPVLGRRVHSLHLTGRSTTKSTARKKITNRNKYMHNFLENMRNFASTAEKSSIKTRGRTKKNSLLIHEVNHVQQHRKKPRRRPLQLLRAAAFSMAFICVAVFALILLQDRFYLPVQYHDNAEHHYTRHRHINFPSTFFAYASPAPATNAELVQLGEKFRERCITCQAKSKLLAGMINFKFVMRHLDWGFGF